jgi:hypothetical protein
MYDERHFYSIDRLVEFGMGTAIAQQMVQSMNQTMSAMRVPGAGNPMIAAGQQQPPQTPPVLYAILDGKQTGPFSETEFARLIAEKKVVKETYVWMPGMKDWQLVENTPAALRLAALAPPQFNPATN